MRLKLLYVGRIAANIAKCFTAAAQLDHGKLSYHRFIIFFVINLFYLRQHIILIQRRMIKSEVISQL